MSWVIKDGQYPYVEGVGVPTAFSYTDPYPKWVWRLSPNYVKYPYLAPLTVISKPSAVKQNDYITVHDMMTKQDEFENNGLRILFSSSCNETEELNGGFEIVLEHPIDKDGAWEQLKELNVLKVNGQLFPIYRVVSNFSGNSGKITAYARHMFYFLLDKWIFSANINALSGQEALAQIMSAAESFSGEGFIDYQFTVASDLEGDFSTVLSEQTPISAIMGSDKSLIEVLGGELYRDNFYFSINKHKEHSKENAFDIRVGLNLQGIKREVDYSDFCTYLRVFDGFGSSWSVSYVPSGRFSHNVVRSVTFKYDSPPGMDRLAKDGMAYFDTVKEPRITYTVSLADVRNNPDYQEFGNLPEYNVGDSGRIYDERLGIYTEQRIIRRKVDRLTGLVKEVTFGNTERSLTRKPKFANTIATADDKYLLNQMTQAEAKNLGTWADAAKYTWGELARFTWGQVGGNNGN